MNATDNTAPAADATVRVTAHSDCDHPRTKAARAACRRGRKVEWVAITRDEATKGHTVRVTAGDVVHEGELIGWGAKRLTVRTADARVNVSTDAIDSVEAKG